jgi:hypothetical protein
MRDFAVALDAVNLDKVPVVSTDRSIERKEQARLARQPFRRLGLGGVSFTAPRYSMAQGVDVKLPAPSGDARGKVLTILARAFPCHEDRGDSVSNHLDYCWFVG